MHCVPLRACAVFLSEHAAPGVQVNVFVLGSVFLQLAQLLRLHDLPIFQRYVFC